MVVSVKEFDKANNSTAIQDTIETVTKIIDKKLLAYTKMNREQRIKNNSMIAKKIIREYNSDNKRPFIVFISEKENNKLAKIMKPFNYAQARYIRKIVQKNYQDYGWYLSWTEWTCLRDITSYDCKANEYKANVIGIAPAEDINEIYLSIED